MEVRSLVDLSLDFFTFTSHTFLLLIFKDDTLSEASCRQLRRFKRNINVAKVTWVIHSNELELVCKLLLVILITVLGFFIFFEEDLTQLLLLHTSIIFLKVYLAAAPT